MNPHIGGRTRAGWISIPAQILEGEFQSSGVKAPSTRQLLMIGVGAASIFGAVMGTFSGLAPGHFIQIALSAIKVPLLLLGSLTLCLPSFFVLNTLFGLRRDFSEAWRAIVMSQTALALVLCSLSPLTTVWYASSGSYRAAVLFNAVLFAMSSGSAQLLLHRLYQPLIRRNSKHRALLRVWLGIYIFVGIQLGWVLRPFVGDPAAPVQWFREDAWGNAYVTVAQLLWNLFRN
ncbi:MAG: hypothetical protein AB1813_25800 [Verrucomicrobiota bacterium]